MNYKTTYLCALALLALISPSAGQTPPRNFTSELAAARREVIETRDFKIAKIDLGAVSPGKNTFTAVVKNKTGSSQTLDPEVTIESTLSAIRKDLIRLKSRFPQLATIDESTIKEHALRYQKGFLKDDKVAGAVFEKNGCDIYVEIKFPATRKDLEMRQLAGSLFPMKKGKSFAVWMLVRAENDEQGIVFTNKVNEIISLRLAQLEKKLK